MTVLLLGSITAVAAAAAVGETLVRGVPRPQGLQGHDDENWPVQLLVRSANQSTATPMLTARYEVLRQMRPGIRRYNMFWSGFESAIASSSTSAIVCPAGTQKVPTSEASMEGFSRFHCYSSSQLH